MNINIQALNHFSLALEGKFFFTIKCLSLAIKEANWWPCSFMQKKISENYETFFLNASNFVKIMKTDPKYEENI